MKSEPETFVCWDACPECGYKFNCAEAIKFKFETAQAMRSKPKPGDLTLCINCTALLIFGPKMKVSLANERRQSFWVRAEIQRLRRAIRHTHKVIGPPP